jgi:uncharacterized protein (DUF2141 family)
MHTMSKFLSSSIMVMASGGLIAAAPAQYRQTIANNPGKCAAGAGPAIKVTVTGIKASGGTLRVQSYRGTKDEWLEKGQWLNRIETPARGSTMTFCVPLPEAGDFGIAVRHDLNGNGKTDLRHDGGGMSNNPSINIFNLGKPSYKKTAVSVGNEVRSITITMKYM